MKVSVKSLHQSTFTLYFSLYFSIYFDRLRNRQELLVCLQRSIDFLPTRRLSFSVSIIFFLHVETYDCQALRLNLTGVGGLGKAFPDIDY